MFKLNYCQNLGFSSYNILSLEKKINQQAELIKSLRNGIKIENEELIKKILNTNNTDLINAAYENIDKIIWTQDDLLKFLHKNDLNITQKSTISLL